MSRAFYVQLFLRVMSWLPLPVIHRLGGMLGRVFYLVNNDLQTIARTNIKLCFPEWEEDKREQLVRDCLKETARAALESGALWLWPADRVLRLVKQVSGGELLEQAMAKGKGVMIASPHLGAWEVVGHFGAKRWPMTCLYRPPRMAELDGTIRDGRGRAGVELAPTDASGVRVLFKVLKRGGLVGLLPDQDPGWEAGVFAPFFNVPTNTMTLLSRLAQKTGAVVLFAYAERLPRGKGYHLYFKSVPEDVSDADPVIATTSLNSVVEDCVRTLPAQYLWVYKRFKTRPEGEKSVYARPKI